ncbi:YihY/virulence factor BrkB family protein [Plantactinospora sp. GCM10030261]|uniref:YihY/virulence factor BrkB family protein n=1 Tax=Plantactinospora sp. GCM10030261 TaxID=3273420 RepID=UPI00361AD45C
MAADNAERRGSATEPVERRADATEGGRDEGGRLGRLFGGRDRHRDDDRPAGSADDEHGPAGPEDGPDSPADLPGTSVWSALKRTGKEFQDDNLTDWAAALTYYGVLSLFPALLVMVSVLGLLGDQTVRDVKDTITDLVPQQETRTIIENAITQVSESPTAGLVAIFGLLGAFWSASGYIGAFIRASNSIYDVPEGRPIWKTMPLRVAVTALVGVMVLASLLIVVFTGKFAERAGEALGLGQTAVTVWDIAKWPVLLALVSLTFAVLYWAAPNARHGGFRWITPGGVFAVVLWVAVSGGFALYVSNFGSYNKTYGALAGVIIFLVWLWLTNLAILLGAELDAELERSRAIAAGLRPPDKEPFVELRDDRTLRKHDEK